MKKLRTPEMDREFAYFRFALIAPVIQGTFTDASIAAYCRRITEEPIVRPDGTAFQYKPATIEKWVSQYKIGGMDALIQKKRSDKGCVRCLTDECIAEIYLLKERFPRIDATQIHIRLIQEGLLPANVSVRTIQRFIKANSLKTAATSGLLKDRKAFEEEYFGAMWQADTCYFPYIPDGNGKRQRTYLMLIVDDHSRMIVGARLFFEDNAYNFQKVLKDAIATYGICQKLYTDHGPSYENSQLDFICGSLGTVLLHAPVRDGAAKAKVERAFGVLKSRWLNCLDTKQILSLEQFNQELTEAVRKHNLSVNASTEQTPMDRFLATRGRIRTPESEQWLIDCFMNRAHRKVRNDSTISLLKSQFDAPMHFIRQTVEIRFLPDQLSQAYILDASTRYPLKLTDKQANSKAKRNNLYSVDYSKGA